MIAISYSLYDFALRCSEICDQAVYLSNSYFNLMNHIRFNYDKYMTNFVSQIRLYYLNLYLRYYFISLGHSYNLKSNARFHQCRLIFNLSSAHHLSLVLRIRMKLKLIYVETGIRLLQIQIKSNG